MSGEALDVGTLTGRIELEDRLSNALEQVGGAISKFEGSWKDAGASILEGAASFVTAEAAIEGLKEIAHLAAETLKELTIEGSHAADIEETFNHLTTAAGQAGDVLLGKMREGLRGTVSDMDIMTRVNDNMVAGLKMSDEQWLQLSNSAFTLAKAKGLETKDVLDKISEALLTGRVRTLASIAGKIDLASAEERYAATLGVTIDHLTAEGKLAGAQAAIMDKVADAAANAGEVHVRLADRINQVRVEFQNFGEELGTAIATSPVLAAGYDAVRQALSEAFGGSQRSAIKAIAETVDDVLIAVVGLAEGAVDAAGVIGVEWNAAKVVFRDIMQIVDGDVLAFEYLAKAIAYVGEVLHIPGAAEEVKRLDDNIQGLLERMTERATAIEKDKQAETEWATASGAVKDKLEEIRQKMIAAKDTENDYSEVIRDNGNEHKTAGEAAGRHGDAEGKLGLTMAMSKEEAKKYNEAMKELSSASDGWQKTLTTISGDVVEAIKYYLQAGVSLDKLATVYGLTATQASAVEKSWKQGTETIKEQIKAAEELGTGWEKYFTELADLTATDLQKANNASLMKYETLVKKLQDMGVADAKYYDEAEALYEKDVKKNEESLVAKDTKSKAYLQQQLRDAQATYDMMRTHSDQYTRQDIDNQGKIVQSLKEMRDHWGQVNSVIDKQTEMVRTLSGQVLTLKEYEARQATGGSFDVTSQNFGSTAASMGWDVSAAAGLARQGYSLSEISEIFHNGNNGPLPPPHGPRIPGFRDGGVGDFGDGTLAVLHGKEAIVPLDKANGIGDTTIVFNVNGTGAQVAQEIKKILMRELKSVRQFGSA